MNCIRDLPQGAAFMLYGPGAKARAFWMSMQRGILTRSTLDVKEFSPSKVQQDILPRALDVLIIHGLPATRIQQATLMALIRNAELKLPDGRVVRTPRVIVCADQGTVPTMALEERRFVIEYCDD